MLGSGRSTTAQTVNQPSACPGSNRSLVVQLILLVSMIPDDKRTTVTSNGAESNLTASIAKSVGHSRVIDRRLAGRSPVDTTKS